MNVASLDNCKKLYEVSGWNDDDLAFYCHGSIYRTMEIDTSDYHQHYPAYELGYLMRMLPNFCFPYRGSSGDWWYMGELTGSPRIPTAQIFNESDAHTPEDAACLLAIEFFKQGILE